MSALAKIFVVDDDGDYLEFVKLLLAKEGYLVLASTSSREALGLISQNPPDLLISDVEMPGLDGFELVKRMGQDVLLRNVPVILMSGKRMSSDDRVTGLGIGSDDYILKPFPAPELLARVKAVLRRAEIGLDANPLTRLPGNSSILREIESRLAVNDLCAILYADLNHFKAFNDRYGFVKGDEVIRYTARVILNCVHAQAQAKDFVGHVGGDDFIVVTSAKEAEKMCKSIVTEFDKGILDFYEPQDKKDNGLRMTDRQGRVVTYPIMGLAIGVVTNEHKVLKSIGEVSQIGAEVKKHAKSLGGSRYVIDRRAKAPDKKKEPKK
jgi:diguanylate cyclase (GGDEF)-like protein